MVGWTGQGVSVPTVPMATLQSLPTAIVPRAKLGSDVLRRDGTAQSPSRHNGAADVGDGPHQTALPVLLHSYAW